jgi:acyl-CoA thioesterase YciA
VVTKWFSVNDLPKLVFLEDRFIKFVLLKCKIIMRFHTRKWVKPEDLNPNSTLFGGRLLAWIDEEIALYAIIQLESPRIVTKHMSEINFRSSAKQGDIVEIGIDVVKFGKTSLTLVCEVRNMMTKETIITIDTITMVSVDLEGKPHPHGKTKIEYIEERLGKR